VVVAMALVCFTVRDLDASIAFYRDKLGLSSAFDFVDDKRERFGVYLHLGGRSFIELFRGELAEPAKGQSFRHICIEVDDVAATVAELRARGVEVTDPKLGSDQSWQAWLADPDGNRIELHGYTPESWQAPHLKP